MKETAESLPSRVGRLSRNILQQELTLLQGIRFLIGLLLIEIVVVASGNYIWKQVDFYCSIRGDFLNPRYIRFYSYKSDLTTKTTDSEMARRLWSAFSVLNRKRSLDKSVASCETEANPCQAYVAYPIHDPGEPVGEIPIFVYADGTILVDHPPRRDNYYHMPRFRDAVMEEVSQRVDAEGAIDVVRGASISGGYRYPTDSRLLDNFLFMETATCTYQEFLDYSYHHSGENGKWNVLGRWRSTSSQGYLYLLSFKYFDAYLLTMVIAPLLMVASLTTTRKWTALVACVLLCGLCVLAGFLRTLPLYDYFKELMPPSRYRKVSACANMSIYTGFFAAALCVSMLPLRPLVHLASRRLDEKHNPTRLDNTPTG